MTLVFVILITLLLVAFALLRIASHQRTIVSRLDELPGLSRAVDLAAFQNLIDPAETRFLKQNLPAAAFRTVERERARAAIEYVRNIAFNAGLLISLGQLNLTNPDPQVAQAARAMVDRALHVRTLAMLALFKLHSRALIPALPFTVENIFRDYDRLTESAVLFTRLQQPAFAGRVSAVL